MREDRRDVGRYLASGLVGALIAALAFVAVLYVADLRISEDSDSTSAEVTVPSVVGEPVSTARAEIEALGLDVRAHTPIFGEATVVGQIPSAGTEVPPDAVVTLK